MDPDKYRPAFLENPIPEEAWEPDVAAQIAQVKEHTGFVPNVFTTLARRPDEFRAFFAYHDALMSKESGLSKAEREMIVVATSSGNSCLYCVVAHGAILRIRAKNPRIADQVAINYRSAELSERERAICAFAIKLAQSPGELDETDYAELHAQGLSDDDIWDVGAITAFFALSNRMASLTQMAPNSEFYALGRNA